MSVAQLDERLESAVRVHERAERLICFYLEEMRDRQGHRDFGFVNIWDYAAERFGFSERKTAYLLRLGQKLKRLPHLAEALASGKLGWTKAARVAEVATAENEVMWVESAISLSVRELERRIRDEVPVDGGRVSVWLTSEQMMVWERALEVCRRMSGANLDASRCLELIAGDFLATYEALGGKDAEEEPSTQGSGVKEEAAEDPADDTLMCPDGDDLPSPVAAPYSEIHRKVLERDGYQCTYPGCTSRMGLHVHHVEHRSRSGSKGRARSNSMDNLTTTCFVHHRMVHSQIIDVKGRGPDKLEWRLPEPMRAARARAEKTLGKQDIADVLDDPPLGPLGGLDPLAPLVTVS
jgi:hypothetical protein